MIKKSFVFLTAIALFCTVMSISAFAADSTSQESQFIEKRFNHIKNDKRFKIISVVQKKDKNTKGEEYVVTSTKIKGNLEEFIEVEKRNGKLVTSLGKSTGTVSIASTEIGDSPFSGIGTKKVWSDRLHMAIYATNGNIDLLNGGLTGARLTFTGISQISRSTGATEFTDLKTKIEVDWDLYGFVGGNAFIVTNYYYLTPDWADGLLSETIDKSKSGMIAYSSLSVSGKYSYKRYGTLNNDTVMAQLTAN